LKRAVAFLRAHLLARAALWFLLFALPWPGVAACYTSVVADGLGVMLGRSGPPVEVTFKAGEPGVGPWEVQTRVSELATGRSLETALDERRTGYLPSAVFLALVLASRFPRRKKAVLAASGLFVLHLLSLLPILAFWSGRLPIVAYDLGQAGRVAVDVLYRSLVAPLGMAYALPGLLWLVLSAVANAPVEPASPPQPTTTARSRRGRRAPAAKRQRTGVTTR
jgi:hypothetical protein